MTKNPETGIVTNIANFESLITYLKGYGPKYDPSNPLLKITALESQYSAMQASQEALTAIYPGLTVARNQRKVAFDPLSPLATRILNAAIASTTTEKTDESIKTLVRKIKGERATPLKSATDQTAADAPAPTQISSSQQGYNDLVENFNKLISLLEKTPEYKPNEAELKIDALWTYHDSLIPLNKAVTEAEVLESNARIQRDELLDKANTGLVDTASDVKNYVKSVFGPTSSQYHQISGLKFTHKY
jgi:hypothetical protein